MIIDLITNVKIANLNASAKFDTDKRVFTVLKGSQISPSESPHFEKTSSYDRRQYLLKNEVNEEFILLENSVFSSQSQAASVIKGSSVNGNKFWITSNGASLGEFLNSQNYDNDVSLVSIETQHRYLIDFLKNIDLLENVLPQKLFNVFQTLNIVSNEIRHSNVIAWLLNPNETHGLKDLFVKRFIREIYSRNYDFLKNAKLDGLYLWDFSKVEVYRERDNIDILLVDRTNKLIIAIENKIKSKEHTDQLARYKNLLKTKYKKEDYQFFFIYLTVNQEESSDEEWIDESYQTILELVDGVLNQLNDKPKSFLEDYIEILRREIMDDEKLAELCKEIYQKHKNAVDLIYQYKPDIFFDISEDLKARLEDEKDYTLNHSVKTIVRFNSPVTKKINDLFKNEAGNWVKDKSILLYEIKINERNVYIMAVVGPSKDPETRKKLIDYYFSNSGENKKISSKWTRLKGLELMKLKKDKETDAILFEMEEGIIDKIKKFTKEIDSIFLNFLSELEK